ncbi:DUF6879 family protein [Streptomyces aidingensis]|uniref:DUF6879 domain-containing protein n=1 Tax=Streptomyces aidingensis TaxID=910347 RepID=A0A1I1FEG8_9ACTN|nr:DUF6879 family protein [Streptomyces aidingensis]SFB97336.1 hypothetical protein SAMN05421773_101689 [Streptomyces aidingensis]
MRLRFTGSNSGKNGCPAFYEDVDSDRIVVQGDAISDHESIAQLRSLEPGEAAVAVPRAVFADFAPKDVLRSPNFVSFDEFESMFTDFQHTAWRLETRRRYRSDEESEDYRRFLAGEDILLDPDDPWCASRREQSALGKRFERVRIVDEPPTMGQLYLLKNARRNSEVGEDIRNLWRADANRLTLPNEDFWLFDSRWIALLHFDDDDNLTGVEMTSEPLRVLRACQIRDAAWHTAVSFDVFEAGIPAEHKDTASLGTSAP